MSSEAQQNTPLWSSELSVLGLPPQEFVHTSIVVDQMLCVHWEAEQVPS